MPEPAGGSGSEPPVPLPPLPLSSPPLPLASPPSPAEPPEAFEPPVFLEPPVFFEPPLLFPPVDASPAPPSASMSSPVQATAQEQRRPVKTPTEIFFSVRFCIFLVIPHARRAGSNFMWARPVLGVRPTATGSLLQVIIIKSRRRDPATSKALPILCRSFRKLCAFEAAG